MASTSRRSNPMKLGKICSINFQCRLCGIDNPNKVRICEEEDDILVLDDHDLPLNKKIECCTGIVVEAHDNMPQMCCSICYDKICDFYEFRLMCTSTDIQTRKVLGLPLSQPKFVEEKVDVKDFKNEISLFSKAGPKSVMDKRREILMQCGEASVTLTNNISESRIKKPKYAIDMNPVVSLKKLKIETPVPKIICSICETIFTNEQDLFAHKYVKHTPTTLIKFGCTSCGYSIMDSKEWNAHKMWHSKSKVPFTCNRCDAEYYKYIDFSKHYQMKSCIGRLEVTVLDIKCDLCRKKFVTRNLYQWHNCFIKNKAHCKKCGKYFAKKQKLFEHSVYCPLPFIDFPKIEVPEPETNYLETSAAAPPVNNNRNTFQFNNAEQLTENELIIKAENNEIDLQKSDIDDPSLCVPEVSIFDTEKQPIEQSRKNKDKKTKEKNKKKSNKRINPLKIRIKKEIGVGHNTEDTYSIATNDKEEQIPIKLNERLSLMDVVIKQEKLNPEYGDVTNDDVDDESFMTKLPNDFNIKTEPNDESPILPVLLENIKKEKPDKGKKISNKKQTKGVKKSKQSKNLAANFVALALKIKQEKQEQSKLVNDSMNNVISNVKQKSKKSKSFVKINPLAAAKKAKPPKKYKNPLARLKATRPGTSELLALKIKKECSTASKATEKKEMTLKRKIKEEPIDEDEDDENNSKANYLGLNPLSIILKKKSKSDMFHSDKNEEKSTETDVTNHTNTPQSINGSANECPDTNSTSNNIVIFDNQNPPNEKNNTDLEDLDFEPVSLSEV